MKIGFDQDAWEDYIGWQNSDPKMLAKINTLIGECIRHPFVGTGKPEPLKRELTGYWSRRINAEHRLVYRLTGKGDDQQLDIIQCRFHY